MIGALTLPDGVGFEFAVLSLSDNIEPIFCFPGSQMPVAAALARAFGNSGVADRECFCSERWMPLMIKSGRGRWLALRGLLGVDRVMPILDLNSPHRRELDLSRAPMDVLRFDEDGCELDLYEGDSLMQSGEASSDRLFGRLAACIAEHGCVGDAADSICALAEIMGCGLELTVSPDDSRDVACGVAAAMVLYMLMLCLRTGADRSCRISIARRDGQVEISGEFELCPDEFCPSDGEEWAEIAACRRLADAHNVPFEYKVERGGVNVRFCPMCREWSRLGIKIPQGLEYD